MWEIYALSIIDELQTHASLKRFSELELAFFTRAQDSPIGKDGTAARGSQAERK